MIRLGTDNDGNPVSVDLPSVGNVLIGGEGKAEVMRIIFEQCELQGMKVFWVDRQNYDPGSPGVYRVSHSGEDCVG